MTSSLINSFIPTHSSQSNSIDYESDSDEEDDKSKNDVDADLIRDNWLKYQQYYDNLFASRYENSTGILSRGVASFENSKGILSETQAFFEKKNQNDHAGLSDSDQQKLHRKESCIILIDPLQEVPPVLENVSRKWCGPKSCWAYAIHYHAGKLIDMPEKLYRDMMQAIVPRKSYLNDIVAYLLNEY